MVLWVNVVTDICFFLVIDQDTFYANFYLLCSFGKNLLSVLTLVIVKI